MIEGIKYILKESARARCIRIAINRSGEVIVTKPRRAPLRLAENFVQEKRVWIEKAVEKMKSRPPLKLRSTRAEFLAGRERALDILKAKVARFNSFYKFFYKKISVRNNSSRLGSCSRGGNLSFSYSIMILPEKAIDYVVVHELCHLKEFNHSRRFWDLVAKTVPDYKIIRKSIRLR